MSFIVWYDLFVVWYDFSRGGSIFVFYICSQ